MSWLVRIQADDFFRAYELLNKNRLELNAPAVVNLAFSLELYIKNIYFALDIEEKLPLGRDGHNILELFRGLPIKTQQEVRNFSDVNHIVAFYSLQTPAFIPLDKNQEPITDILEQKIYSISDAFQKWRYSYENSALQYEENVALALIKAFKSVADSTRK